MKVVNIPLEIVDSHAKFSDLAGHHIQNFGKEELCFMSNDIRMSPVVAGKNALVCICEEKHKSCSVPLETPENSYNWCQENKESEI